MKYRKSAHNVYELEYHVVFCTKYRYRALCGEVANRCRKLIKEICAANYIDIIGGSISPDHVYILMSVLPHIPVSKGDAVHQREKQPETDLGVLRVHSLNPLCNREPEPSALADVGIHSELRPSEMLH